MAHFFGENCHFLQRLRLAVRGQGQPNHKAGAALGTIFAVHSAAMTKDDGFHQSQAQPDTAIMLGGPVQSIKWKPQPGDVDDGRLTDWLSG